MSDQLPEFRAGDPVSASKLNTMADVVRAMQGRALDDPGDAPSRDRLCEVIPRAKVPGRIGVYTGSRFHGSPVPKASGDLAIEDLGSVPASDDVTIYNLAEVGGGGGELVLGRPYAGYVRIADVGGKPVVYVSGPSMGRLGIVQCFGPRGKETDPDFTDNRYWFKWGVITTDDESGEKAKLVVAAGDWPEYDDPEASGEGGSGESAPTIRRGLPYATHIFEHCGSHTLKPGQPVYVHEIVDAGTPGTIRYWIEAAKEAECLEGCGSSSSSKSSEPSSEASSSLPSSPSSGSGSLSASSDVGSVASSSAGSSGVPSDGSSGPSGSVEPSGGSGGTPSQGSDKSTAIVPAPWSDTGYVALFTEESPDVRFNDVLVATIDQADALVAIDSRFIEVCEPASIEVCGTSCDHPVMVGAVVDGAFVRVRFSRRAKRKVRVVLRLSGIRKGFAGKRFPTRTRNQFEHNERFINSAYPRE